MSFMHFFPQGKLKKTSVLTIWIVAITCVMALGVIIGEYGNYSVMNQLRKFDERYVTTSVIYSLITVFSVLFVFIGQFLFLINLQKSRWVLLFITALIIFFDGVFWYLVLSAQPAVSFEPTFPHEGGYTLRSPKFGVMMRFFYWHLIGFVVLPATYKVFKWLYGMVKDDFFNSNTSAK